MSYISATFILNMLLVIRVSSLRITCSYHDNRFYVGADFIGVTLAIPLMVSFGWVGGVSSLHFNSAIC